MDTPIPESYRCTGCHGDGILRDQRGAPIACPVCHGDGAAFWLAGRWWAWRHPINELSILERHLERIVTLVISAFLFIVAFAGVFVGGQKLVPAYEHGGLLTTVLSRDWSMAAWWLGLVAAMYLTYRLERDRTLFAKIPVVVQEVAVGTTVPWDDKKTADMSVVFQEESINMLERAWRLAKDGHSAALTPLHLLVTLTTVPAVASMMVRMGLGPHQVVERAMAMIGRQPAGDGTPVFNGGTRELLGQALQLAAHDGRTRVTPSYFMAALAAFDDPARELIYDLGVDDDKLRHVVAWLMIQEDLRRRIREYQARAAMKPSGAIDRAYTASATPTLDRFSYDLTRAASRGGLPYVVGRDEALQRIFRVMESGRRSVILVGDSGVGKTTVLYALAERMASEMVPSILEDKRLVVLSATELVAGAGAIGQLEKRLSTIVNEISRAGNIVLAIENFDQLVGISSTGGQGMDLAQLLGQALEHHAFLLVATANIDSYRQYVEHGTLLSVLEKVDINEMTPDESIVALESRVGGLEYKHQVFFLYDAIERSVILSHRYLHEKTLPGKALTLLEEAAVLARKARGKNTLVSGEDVATIVSELTKMNVRDVTSDEQDKLMRLEEAMHRRIVGQDEAVNAVANALRRARAELRDNKRPIASLMFLGPTGVGKTELAKTVAEVYFGSESNMIRLDMSEYQDLSSINRLIGAPPGYSGSLTGGYLTEAVRHQPFALVLLDELEKAHPDILNLFLQVMDDGRLTDATGRTIDFTNVILIATSNAGTKHIQDRLTAGAALDTIKQELVSDVLLETYRPEFLNRFDAIILFTPLNPVEVRQIVGLMISQIAKQLDLKGIHLRAAPEAVDELAAAGFDPLYGARPLRRIVQERVDNALAKFLLQGKLNRRDVAVLDAGGVIRVESAAKL